MKRSTGIVLLVFLIVFVISFVTNILGPLVPDIIKGFSLSLTLAGLLPFSFFVGWLGDQFGLRVGMTVLFVSLGYILSIGLWAKPLIDNATVSPAEFWCSLIGGKTD